MNRQDVILSLNTIKSRLKTAQMVTKDKNSEAAACVRSAQNDVIMLLMKLNDDTKGDKYYEALLH